MSVDAVLQRQLAWKQAIGIVSEFTPSIDRGLSEYSLGSKHTAVNITRRIEALIEVDANRSSIWCLDRESPDVFQRVLVWSEQLGYGVAAKVDGQWIAHLGENCISINATHWLPLPAEPVLLREKKMQN